MSGHEPKSQGYQYGPVRSPMEEDFKPEDGHEPVEGTITNGVPGYPKGSDRKLKEVVIWEGGNFGHFRRDHGKE